jgi:hypothetical protein
MSGITASLVIALAFAAAPQNGASTPKEALDNYINSIASGDRDLFLASTTGLPAVHAKAVFNCATAAADFSKAFEAAYGKTAAQGLAQAPYYSDYQKLLTPRMLKTPSDALLVIPEIRRTGKFWTVDISDRWRKEEPNFVMEYMNASAKVLRRTRALIGRRGYSPDKVKAALQEGHCFAFLDAGCAASPTITDVIARCIAMAPDQPVKASRKLSASGPKKAHGV